ncbi:MAG TPA: HAD-IA family hydrolase [Patescibacteria group bacterium]|nr:HAD-IA family hydrolase [Patescibacteria group bacterium]
MPLAALLFDLDGTMALSDTLHLHAFQIVAARYDVSFDLAYFNQEISGQTNEVICKRLFSAQPVDDHPRIAEEKEALFRGMIGGLQPVAGLHALLDWADERDLRLAVVSNAPRANITAALDALGVTERFDAVVSGEELPRGKPDPLPYLTALAALGVAAEAAVVFEDAVPGIAAATGAAITTIGVTTNRPHAVLTEAGAAITLADFTDTSLLPFLIGRME